MTEPRWDCDYTPPGLEAEVELVLAQFDLVHMGIRTGMPKDTAEAEVAEINKRTAAWQDKYGHLLSAHTIAVMADDCVKDGAYVMSKAYGMWHDKHFRRNLIHHGGELERPLVETLYGTGSRQRSFEQIEEIREDVQNKLAVVRTFDRDPLADIFEKPADYEMGEVDNEAAPVSNVIAIKDLLPATPDIVFMDDEVLEAKVAVPEHVLSGYSERSFGRFLGWVGKGMVLGLTFGYMMWDTNGGQYIADLVAPMIPGGMYGAVIGLSQSPVKSIEDCYCGSC